MWDLDLVQCTFQVTCVIMDELQLLYDFKGFLERVANAGNDDYPRTYYNRMKACEIMEDMNIKLNKPYGHNGLPLFMFSWPLTFDIPLKGAHCPLTAFERAKKSINRIR